MMLVVFGSLNVDLVFSVSALPRPGETALGPEYRVVAGGKGANQAVAAARDGARVAMYGRIGRDSFAETALSGLKEAKVDVAGVLHDDAATGCAAICVDPQGENQIVVAAGANAHAHADQVPDAALTPLTTVLMQMEVSPGETAALIRRAHARGSRVILNFAPAGSMAGDVLGLLDALIVNEGEAAMLAREHRLRLMPPEAMAHDLAQHVSPQVVVTLGSAGAVVVTRQDSWRIPPLPVTPVDTTAAGDAFVGVLAAALVAGLDLRLAARRASVAAGLACLTLGAQPSLPHRAAIDAALADLSAPT